MALFACSSCAFSSNSALRQRIHNRGHSAASCRRCRRRFASAHGLLLHRKLGRCTKPKLPSLVTSDGRRNSTTDQQSPEKQINKLSSSEPTRGPPSLRCSKCSKAFAMRHSFFDHIKYSKSCGSRSEQYKCYICNAGFAVPSMLRKHASSGKGCQRRLRVAKLRADLSLAKGTSPGAKDPSHSHHNSVKIAEPSLGPAFRPSPCPKCGKMFGKRSGLINHASYAKSCGSWAERFRCARCEATFPLPGGLRLHLAQPRLCQIRLRKATIAALVGPPRSREKNASASRYAKNYACPSCQKTFASRDSLLGHLARSLSCGDKDREFVCDDCGGLFPDATHLLRHQRSAAACGRRRRQLELLKDLECGTTCPRCQATFDGAHQLQGHITQCKKISANSALFTCAKCRAGFNGFYALARHCESATACRIQQRRKELLKVLKEPPKPRDEPLRGPKEASAQSELVKAAGARCPRCGASFKLLHGLGLHMSSAKACEQRLRRQSLQARIGGELSCLKCRRPFAERQQLLSHLNLSRSCGDRTDRFDCARCGATFPQQSAVTAHQKTGKACEQRLRTRQLLLDVLGEEVGELSCPRCHLSVQSIQQLVNHVSSKGLCSRPDASVACPRCSQEFRLLSELGSHRRKGKACAARLRARKLAAKANGAACSSCSRVFADQAAVLLHLRQSKACGWRAEEITCDGCGGAFGQACELTRHLATGKACALRLRDRELRQKVGPGSGPGQHRCLSCRRDFVSWSKIFAHLSFSRSCGDRAKRFACPTCDAKFPQQWELTTHQRGGRACRARLRQKEILALAQSRQEGRWEEVSGDASAQTSCPKCQMSMKSRQRLLDHLTARRSCGDRRERHPCPGCGKAFPYASDLARHQRSLTACPPARKEPRIMSVLTASSPANPAASKKPALLRCPNCAYMTSSNCAMERHQSRPKACRVQSSRIQSLCASLASSACPNCSADQGDSRGLTEHLAHGSLCVRMPSFTQPAIPALESRLGMAAKGREA